MRAIPATLMAHYRGDVTRLAQLFRITRTDGVELYLTDHDADIVHDGHTYTPSNAATPSAITTTSDMSVDNAEVTGVGAVGVVPAGAITLQDQLSGLYDGAEVRIYRVCYEHPEWGVEQLKRGWLGTLSASPSSYSLELRGLADVLQREVGVVLQPSCRADLGGYLCGVDLVPFTRTAAVSSVDSLQQFTCAELDAADGYYLGGKALFLSGANAGVSLEVKHSTAAGVLVLVVPSPNAIAVGDVISIHAGCDHTIATCRDRFANLRSFCGEPCVNPDRTVNPTL